MTDALLRPLPKLPIRWDQLDAVLFDLDGVLTPTSVVHERAWKEMFDAYLAGVPVTGLTERPFGADDYLRYVDGRARFDGVRAFLASRGLALPDGDVGDAPGNATVSALGNRKNELFSEVLRRDGMKPYPGSVLLLDLLESAGTPMAVVSSSRNAPDVLRAAGLASRFSVVIDGNVAAQLGLAGKPAPDMYLAAAAALGAGPSRSAIVEDALAGVAAGRAGGFGLVVGVDRGAGAQALLADGVDVVVRDLSETLP